MGGGGGAGPFSVFVDDPSQQVDPQGPVGEDVGEKGVHEELLNQKSWSTSKGTVDRVPLTPVHGNRLGERMHAAGGGRKAWDAASKGLTFTLAEFSTPCTPSKSGCESAIQSPRQQPEEVEEVAQHSLGSVGSPQEEAAGCKSEGDDFAEESVLSSFEMEGAGGQVLVFSPGLTVNAAPPVPEETPSASVVMGALSEDAQVLDLNAFHTTPWLEFGSVTVGETAVRSLRLENSSIICKSVQLVRGCPGFSVMHWKTTEEVSPVEVQGEITIFNNSSELVVVEWCPLDEAKVSKTLQFLLDGKFRLSIHVQGTATVAPSKKKGLKSKKKLTASSNHGTCTSRGVPSASVSASSSSSAASLPPSRPSASNKGGKSGASAFRATSLDKRILTRTVGVPEKPAVVVTKPKPFAFGRVPTVSKDGKLASTEECKVVPSQVVQEELASKQQEAIRQARLEQQQQHKKKEQAGARRVLKVPNKTLSLSKGSKSDADASLLCTSSSSVHTTINKHRSRGMFGEERGMEKQEEAFTKFLNHQLVAANDTIQAFSVASDVESKQMAPQHRIEQNRQRQSIRRRVCSIFQSEQMTEMIFLLEQEIESGRIAVRPDRHLHADLGLQQQLMDILLSYHPIWLRIGLETIFNEILPMKSVDDFSTLSKFIHQRMFFHSAMASQLSSTSGILNVDVFQVEMQRLFLCRFLVLVLLLDVCKQNSILPEDVCLFNKESSIKSSQDVLTLFAQKILSGEGNILRHLKFLGFQVVYRQSALEEFDFKTRDLSQDLRDGLRLCRLIEKLKGDGTSLCKQLRLPAETMSQKLYNVGVALEALKEAGVSLHDFLSNRAEESVQLDDMGASSASIVGLPKTSRISKHVIEAKDIVGGNRQRTLGLLWKIISHWQIPCLVNVTTLKEEIQRLRAISSVTPAVARSLESAETYFRSEELQVLLEWCQAVCILYGLQVENFTTSFQDGRAICYLIHHYQPSLLHLEDIQDVRQARESDQSQGSSSAGLTSNEEEQLRAWRMSFSPTTGEPSAALKKFRKMTRNNLRLASEKAHLLGRVPVIFDIDQVHDQIPDEKVILTFVAYLSNRLLDLRKETQAAYLIQGAWQAFKARKVIAQRKEAAARLDRLFQGIHDRHQQIKQAQAARVIQCFARRFAARKQFLQTRKAIVSVQRMFRLHLAAEKAADEAILPAILDSGLEAFQRRAQHVATMRRVRASICLQSAFRGFCARKSFVEQRSKVVKIQAFMRMARERSKFLRLREAVVHCQSLARCRQQRSSFLLLKSKSVLLQQQFRMQQFRRRLVSLRSLHHRAATTIQKNVRMWSARRTFAQLQQRIRAATVLQSVVRQVMARRSFLLTRQSVIKVQALARGRVLRQAFLQQRQAAITLQSAFRGWQQQKSFASIRASVIRLQSVARMLPLRRRFVHMQKSAIVLQRATRCFLAVRHFREHQSAVLTLQRFARGFVARCQFRRQMQQVRKCQASVRGFLARRRYSKLQRAAGLGQSLWRRHVALASYTKLRQAAVAMQARFRCNRQRVSFLEQKTAVIKIQAAVRGFLARQNYQRTRQVFVQLQAVVRAKQQRSRFLELRHAVHFLHERRHAVLCGRRDRNAFVAQKKATLVLQTAFRRIQTQRVFQEQIKSIVRIQALVRGWLASTAFQRIRRAAVVLQQKYRRMMMLRRCRGDFLAMKSSAERVQRWFRCRQAVRQLADLREKRDEQQCQQMLSIVMARRIQRSYRSFVERRKEKQRQEAASMLQSWWRRRCGRPYFLRLRAAALLLQRRFRGSLSRQSSAIVTVQRVIRGFLARRQAQRVRKAILCIQATWRGHVVRQREVSRKHAEARKRIRAATARLEEPMRLGNRTSSALSVLLTSKKMTFVMNACETLDVTTRLSKECCVRLVEEGAIPTMFALIRSCNRSKPHMEVLKLCLRILNNVSQHSHFLDYLFQCEGSVDVLSDLLQMFRDKHDVFALSCGILLAFSKDLSKAAAMVSNKDVMRRLKGVLSIMQSKQSMENLRNKPASSSSRAGSSSSGTSAGSALKSLNELVCRLEEAAP